MLVKHRGENMRYVKPEEALPDLPFDSAFASLSLICCFFVSFFRASMPEFGPQNPAPGPIFYVDFEFEVNNCGFLHPEAKI